MKTSLEKGPKYGAGQNLDIDFVLFDVDNTLVGNEVPDLPSKLFIEMARGSRGTLKIGIASARQLAKVRHILDAAKIEGLCVLNNGAQIYDPIHKEVIEEWLVPNDVALNVMAYGAKIGVKCWINDDGIDHYPEVTDCKITGYQYHKDMWSVKSPFMEAKDYLPKKPFCVVLKHLSKKQLEQVEMYVIGLEHPEIKSLVVHEAVLDDGKKVYDLLVAHKNADKATAIRRVSELSGVTLEHLATVGDGRNDAVLLEAAGVGVAMGNAAAETLAVATYVAPNQWDDGAAAALQFLLDQKMK
jgi:hydroxymethylpyrimidine pyrophosphatase-like HAD family hydrolase